MPLYPGSNGGGIAISNLPISFTHWHDESIIVSGGVLIVDNYSNYFYGTLVYQNLSTIGDAFQFSKLLDAGTYNFYALAAQGVNRGIIRLNVNGSDAANDLDLYGGSYSNVTLHTQMNITTPGMQMFTLTTVGKNIASSAYNIVLTKMWGIKQ